MGKTWRQITASGLLAVYSVALMLVCCFGYDLHAQQPLQQSGAENYQTIVTGNQPGAALLVNKPIDAGFNVAHKFNKNSFNEFLAVLKTTEKLFASSFTHYASFSSNIPIRQRKADIIFPFHYFW